MDTEYSTTNNSSNWNTIENITECFPYFSATPSFTYFNRFYTLIVKPIDLVHLGALVISS